MGASNATRLELYLRDNGDTMNKKNVVLVFNKWKPKECEWDESGEVRLFEKRDAVHGARATTR